MAYDPQCIPHNIEQRSLGMWGSQGTYNHPIHRNRHYSAPRSPPRKMYDRETYWLDQYNVVHEKYIYRPVLPIDFNAINLRKKVYDSNNI